MLLGTRPEAQGVKVGMQGSMRAADRINVEPDGLIEEMVIKASKQMLGAVGILPGVALFTEIAGERLQESQDPNKPWRWRQRCPDRTRSYPARFSANRQCRYGELPNQIITHEGMIRGLVSEETGSGVRQSR